MPNYYVHSGFVLPSLVLSEYRFEEVKLALRFESIAADNTLRQ